MKTREFVLTMALMMGLASCGPAYLADFLDPIDDSIFDPISDDRGICSNGLVSESGRCIAACTVDINDGEVTDSEGRDVQLSTGQSGMLVSGDRCPSVKLTGQGSQFSRDLHLQDIRQIEMTYLTWEKENQLRITKLGGARTRILVKQNTTLPDKVEIRNANIFAKDDAQLRLKAVKNPSVHMSNVDVKSQGERALVLQFPSDKETQRWAELNKSYSFENTRVIGMKTPIVLTNYPLMEAKNIQMVQGNSPFRPRMELDLASYYGVNGRIQQGVYFMAGAYVGDAANLTIDAGAVLKLKGGLITVQSGQLSSNGTAQNPVIMTSYFDDTAGGDLNGDGNVSHPKPAQWRGLRIKSGDSRSFVSLNNTEVRYAGISVAKADLEMTDSDLINPVTCTDGNFAHYSSSWCSDSYLKAGMMIYYNAHVKMMGTNVIRDAEEDGVFLDNHIGTAADTKLEIIGELLFQNIAGENIVHDSSDPGTVIGHP